MTKIHMIAKRLSTMRLHEPISSMFKSSRLVRKLEMAKMAKKMVIHMILSLRLTSSGRRTLRLMRSLSSTMISSMFRKKRKERLRQQKLKQRSQSKNLIRMTFKRRFKISKLPLSEICISTSLLRV